MRCVRFIPVITGLVASSLCAQIAVTTMPPAGVSSYVAILKGSVNPNGLDTHVWFQYSPNSNMTGDLTTLVQDIGSGTTLTPFQTKVIGLTGNKTYYFQAFASNSAGSGQGAALSFTTGTTPQLSLSITHAGTFAQGQNGATYTLTVSNAAAGGPTADIVSVTETIPTGLTLVSMSGSSWACQHNACNRNDILAPGTSWSPITVVVNVAPNAPSHVTNNASVSGPGLFIAYGTDVTAITSLTTEQQFINTVNAAIATESAALGPVAHPLVFSGSLVYANGATITGTRLSVLLDYVDGLKAAGAQRIDINPGVTSIYDPNATALYDAVVRHIRELGLQLALNPEIVAGDFAAGATFADFQAAALTTYPQLAARYQPDNFVIVHEPTTMAARLGVQTAVSDWDNFIQTVAPLIKSASPQTRIGAGGFFGEDTFYRDFLGITSLDFMTMSIYDDAHFAEYVQWAQEAHAAADATHPNGKAVYIGQTWAPYYLPSPLPANWQVQTLDNVALVGSCNSDFTGMDTNWLQLMAQFASANGMEALTASNTQAFFQFGTANADRPADAAYSASVQAAIQQGQLTATGQSYMANSKQWGLPRATSLSSASYATWPTVFSPNCGTGGNPCNANVTVAPDSLVSAFGSDLATSVELTKSASFPTTLAGTTMKLVDSSNTAYDAGMYFSSPGQVNYLIPAGVKPGPATINIISSDGAQTSGSLLISAVAPGIYTAMQSGSGPASGIAICAGTCSGWPNSQGNGQFYQNTFAAGCTAASCTAQPISLGGASDQVVVELFGTGIRHVSSLSAVTATINGQSIPVVYAGAQGQYPGLDQVNVLIPHSLAGSGVSTLVLSVQDAVNNVNTTSNTVTLHIL
jgi:uncharacterized protein (TIGR03437 family)